MNRNDDALASMENAMIRSPSKVFFRKWKHCSLCLFKNCLVCNLIDGEILEVKLDSSMRLSNVFEHKLGSLIEGKKQIVYFCRLVRELGTGIGERSKQSDLGPSPFHDRNETETVMKFGSENLEEITRFSKKLESLLTQSYSWETYGRTRLDSKIEYDDEVRDLGRNSVHRRPEYAKPLTSLDRERSPYPEVNQVIEYPIEKNSFEGKPPSSTVDFFQQGTLKKFELTDIL